MNITRVMKAKKTFIHIKTKDYHLYGMSYETFKILQRTDDLSKKQADKLSSFFGNLGIFISADWFLTGKGESPFNFSDSISSLSDKDYIEKQYDGANTISITASFDICGIINTGDLVLGLETELKYLVPSNYYIFTENKFTHFGKLLIVEESHSLIEVNNEVKKIKKNKVFKIIWIRKY